MSDRVAVGTWRSLVQRLVTVVACAAMVGCAVTPQQFAAEKYSLSDERVCRTWKTADQNGGAAFELQVREELARRGLDAGRCEEIVSQQNTKAVVGALAVLAVVAAAAAASRGGGGGGAATPYAPTTDYDWDWDLFYNQYRQLVWACRGVQTGQFADLGRCQYKMKTDSRWPSLEAPR